MGKGRRMERFGGGIVWQENQLLLSSEIFKQMSKYKVTFKQLAEFCEKYIEFRNSFFVGSPCNSEIYLQKHGKKFAFAIFYPGKHLTKHGEFNLWHETYDSLGEYNIDENMTPDENFIEWLDNKINNFIGGKINCSDCGKIISNEEVAGKYFAGQYCEECWERTWREIEAKETYN